MAVLTGATGGIGAEVAAGLCGCGYTVIVAARDTARGSALVHSLRAAGGQAELVEFHAERARSAIAVSSALRGRPCALLINNAGVMSTRKDEILRVNLVGPALLTLALLPALRLHGCARHVQDAAPYRVARLASHLAACTAYTPSHAAQDAPHSRRRRSPRVVNVGSSSHLRAACVNPATLHRTNVDRDLTAYAQSKLGLMQSSTLLRAALPWLTIVDAHPGLVWTPMLQRHWGALAPHLESSRLATVLFKTPAVAATTVLTAAFAPRSPPRHWGERSRWRRGWEAGPYFVNQRPGGFASSESRDEQAARVMWAAIIEPAAREIAPASLREVSEGLLGRLT